MIDLNIYIKESLFDADLTSKDPILYHPKTKLELINCIKKEIDKQGPDANLNYIDVSKIIYMADLFYGLEDQVRNVDISLWDVSNVMNMNSMFSGCKEFNCDLSKWDVSNVADMSSMFDGCKNFNSDISKWDVSNVEYMMCMFDGCEKFNQDLSKWNVKKVYGMDLMFNRCKTLKKLKKIPDWYHE